MNSPILVDVTAFVREMLLDTKRITFPSARYRNDPVAFYREILGLEPWSRQVELLNALRDHDKVAVKSGRRVSKSNSAGGAALWWYCSYPNAQIIMTSTTSRQVDGILWREVDILRGNSGRCVACRAIHDSGREVPIPCPHSARIGGDIGQLARTGLKTGVDCDKRSIAGFTARTPEAFQGYAGAGLLFIVDEASGVERNIFTAIKGNLAGGGKMLLLGNPTQNEGEFFDAFHSLKRDPSDPDGTGYHALTISSEESPNVVEGREVIPGLATRTYIREREIEWGRDSPLFQIHVLGEFAVNEAGRIFSLDAIQKAQTRWTVRATNALGELYEFAPDPSLGRLFIGLDPAGATGMGDDTVFCFRRGPHVVAFEHRRGLDDEAHLIQLIALMAKRAAPGETPVVVLDASGSIGASLGGRLRGYAEQNPRAFRLLAMRGSDRAVRDSMVYDRVRDELTGNLEKWLRAGGEIPADDKLAGEMHAMEWEIQPGSGRQKVTAKTKLKRELGRSPDRYDALALACYEPQHMDEQAPARDERGIHDTVPGREFDPREGLRAFR